MSDQLLILWGDGVHDDREALLAVCAGKPVIYRGEMYQSDRGLAPSAIYYIPHRCLPFDGSDDYLEFEKK